MLQAPIYLGMALSYSLYPDPGPAESLKYLLPAFREELTSNYVHQSYELPWVWDSNLSIKN